MGKRLDHINVDLQKFIEKQKIFFVGTALPEGTVNISPKGLDSLRIIDKNKVVWLNLTGSGNETATHLIESSRMTIMFCAFEGKPLILRLYGQAKVYHARDEEYQKYISLFEPSQGARQIIEMQVNLVQTSCGYAVPLMDFKEERTQLTKWNTVKGEVGIKEFWDEHNLVSLDGHDTKLYKD